MRSVVRVTVAAATKNRRSQQVDAFAVEIGCCIRDLWDRLGVLFESVKVVVGGLVSPPSSVFVYFCSWQENWR